MSSRRHLNLAWPLLLAGALMPGCGSGGSGHGSGEPLNVLLIVVDTLRADHLSCYGYDRETSPNIDALAAGGWRFENAHSQAPWTTPSLGALFTSRYPSALGIEDLSSVVPEELTLLPEALGEHGYATGAVVSHNFCSSEWGFNQGYDSFDETNVLGHFGISSEGVSDAGIAFLDGRPGAGADAPPFFLWLHYFDPHNQYIPHDGYGEPQDPEYRGRVSPKTPFLRLKKLGLKRREIEEVQRYYDSEIEYTDEQIGRVLDHLDQLGLTDSTVVIFTADHGEEFFEHGRLGHAHSLFQELVHVPLIVRVPGQPARTIRDTVATMDIYPTVLELVNLPPPDGLEGRSLLSTEARTVISETSRHANLRSIVRGRRKVVLDLETGTFAAFDLDADPGEKAPLPVAEGDELAAELTAWMDRMRRTAISGGDIQLDPAMIEELGDLGYVEDAGDE